MPAPSAASGSGTMSFRPPSSVPRRPASTAAGSGCLGDDLGRASASDRADTLACQVRGVLEAVEVLRPARPRSHDGTRSPAPASTPRGSHTSSRSPSRCSRAVSGDRQAAEDELPPVPRGRGSSTTVPSELTSPPPTSAATTVSRTGSAAPRPATPPSPKAASADAARASVDRQRPDEPDGDAGPPPPAASAEQPAGLPRRPPGSPAATPRQHARQDEPGRQALQAQPSRARPADLLSWPRWSAPCGRRAPRARRTAAPGARRRSSRR